MTRATFAPSSWPCSSTGRGMTWNVAGSGMATMSDSSIALKPVIEEPSKPIPSSSAPSISDGVTANDLRWPSRSVNQRDVLDALVAHALQDRAAGGRGRRRAVLALDHRGGTAGCRTSRSRHHRLLPGTDSSRRDGRPSACDSTAVRRGRLTAPRSRGYKSLSARRRRQREATEPQDSRSPGAFIGPAEEHDAPLQARVHLVGRLRARPEPSWQDEGRRVRRLSDPRRAPAVGLRRQLHGAGGGQRLGLHAEARGGVPGRHADERRARHVRGHAPGRDPAPEQRAGADCR